MIKLTSFYPFSSFLRVTQEFHEDKATVKTKSLSFEREFEFDYKDVGEISDAYLVSESQNIFSFWLLVFAGIVLTLLSIFTYFNLILLRLLQTIYVCGVVLYVTSFVKSWYINFTDKNDNFLTRIKQTRHNHDLISAAIETIKNKSKDVQEISSAVPFPEATPTFEHIDYDILNMKKATERFYENEILGFQKNLSGEFAYEIKYDQLSGKIYRGKVGNDVWCSVLTVFLLLMSVMNGLFFGFGIHLFRVPVYFLYSFAVIFAISLIFKFVKRELIGLYGTNGNIEYWTWVTKSNKKKIEEIIEFIQSRIPVAKNDRPSNNP